MEGCLERKREAVDEEYVWIELENKIKEGCRLVAESSFIQGTKWIKKYGLFYPMWLQLHFHISTIFKDWTFYISSGKRPHHVVATNPWSHNHRTEAHSTILKNILLKYRIILYLFRLILINKCSLILLVYILYKNGYVSFIIDILLRNKGNLIKLVNLDWSHTTMYC